MKKIDILLKNKNGFWRYEASTNWSKTLKQAKEKFLKKEKHLSVKQIKTVWGGIQ